MTETVKLPKRLAHLKFELNYWGDCANTHDEDTKQLAYAACMGLTVGHRRVELVGQPRVLDVGAGPSSMLLKATGRGRGCVAVDPLMGHFPRWVRNRYDAVGVMNFAASGEELPPLKQMGSTKFDEVWLYNVLQHVEDPEKVVRNCRRAGRVLRVFEWVGIPAHEGHPHVLSSSDLERWSGSGGTLRSHHHEPSGLHGTSWSGVFPT